MGVPNWDSLELSKRMSAVVTKMRFILVGFCRAIGTAARGSGAITSGQFRCHNACWHGDDCIPNDHDYGGKRFSKRCFGAHVPVSHGGQRDNRPVDAHGDTAETMFLSLYEIHQGADDDHERYHGNDENRDFRSAGP